MRNILLLLATAIFMILPANLFAGGRLVIVVIGGTSLEDLAANRLPNISRLINDGAVGLMNVRPASRLDGQGVPTITGYSMAGTCATIGAGTRVSVTTDAGRAFVISEMIDGRPAKQFYLNQYGRLPDPAEIIHLGMTRLRSVNKQAGYPVEPGALGDALHKAGIRTGFIGNSDIPGIPMREASLIAADSRGRVDYGYCGDRLIRKDPSFPFGVRTDQTRLAAEFSRVLPLARFIVIDLGDTTRASNYLASCSEEQGELLKRQALASADRVLGIVLPRLDLARDRILVLSTNPHPFSKNDFLTPVIAAGRGIDEGLLSSGSTRRPGIVVNTDISAWVLEFFGAEVPYTFVGRQCITIPGTFEQLLDTNLRIIHQIDRQPAMQGISIFLLCFVPFLSILAIWGRETIVGCVRWAALLPAAIMLAVLWQPAIADPGLVGAILIVIILSALLMFTGWLILRSPSRTLAWMCSVLALTVVLDLACGGFLVRDSIMSYTPVEGARYYGIGNYQLGCTLGAATIAAGFLASALSKTRTLLMALPAAALVALVAVIGLPSLGADAGGAMSGGAAVVTALILWRNRGFDKRFAIYAVLIIPVSLALLIALDLLRSGAAQSHIGRSAELISSGGVIEIWMIIERKMGVNIRLLCSSPWGKLLGVSIISAILMVGVPQGEGLARLKTDRHIYSALIATLVGTSAAFLLNDSGTVAAATAFIYVWMLILLMVARPNAARNILAGRQV